MPVNPWHQPNERLGSTGLLAHAIAYVMKLIFDDINIS